MTTKVLKAIVSSVCFFLLSGCCQRKHIFKLSSGEIVTCIAQQDYCGVHLSCTNNKEYACMVNVETIGISNESTCSQSSRLFWGD